MDRLSQIETPILFIAGGDDRPEYSSAGAYIERKMPSARLVVISGAGHVPQETHAEIVATQIDEFASGLPT